MRGIFRIKKGYNKKELYKVTAKSMMPAGTIILLAGAGSVFKQMLLDTGAGTAIATSLADLGIPILLFAFLGSSAAFRI